MSDRPWVCVHIDLEREVFKKWLSVLMAPSSFNTLMRRMEGGVLPTQ